MATGWNVLRGCAQRARAPVRRADQALPRRAGACLTAAKSSRPASRPGTQDERRLIQEGYELLDEKRVLLATEIMRQLRHYAALQDELRRLGAQALETLEGAVACTASTSSPSSPSSTSAPPARAARAVVPRPAAGGGRARRPGTGAGTGRTPTTPEARACALTFRALVMRHVELRRASRACGAWCASTSHRASRTRAENCAAGDRRDAALHRGAARRGGQEEAVRVRNAPARVPDAAETGLA